MINVAFVQPLWVANARLKLQGTQGHGAEKYKGVLDVLFKIYAEEGFVKLWSGVSSSMMLCLNPAIQFAVYETVKRVLLKRKTARGLRPNLGSAEAFVLGAVSKCFATLATYPLQVAQTRLRFAGDETQYRGTFDCVAKIYRKEGSAGLYR